MNREELRVHSGNSARSPSDPEGDDLVVSYPPEAVLEIAHVAAWLRVSQRTVERLDIPFALLGRRTKRFLGKDVLEFLERKRIG